MTQTGPSPVQAARDTVRDGAWLTLARLRTYATILLVAYGIFIVWLLVTADGPLDVQGRPIGTDFANLWGAGYMVLGGRAAAVFDIRDLAPFVQSLFGLTQDQFWGWHYPPPFLAVAAALATMPYLVSLAIWMTATGALYLAAIRLCLPLTARHARLVLLVALAYPAVFANLTHGHNGFLTAGLFGLGLALLEARPRLAGIMFGLLAYKPQYGLLLPFALAAGGYWRTIAAAAATVVFMVILSLAAFGPEAWTAFAAHAGFTRAVVLEQGAPGWFKLQGVFPAVRLLGADLALAYSLQAATTATMVIAVIWLWRRPVPLGTRGASLLLATMLATPYAFNYDSMLLAPAIALIVADGLRRGFAPFEASALALLWAIPLVSRELTAATCLPIAVLAQVLVFALLIRRVAAEAAHPHAEPSHGLAR